MTEAPPSVSKMTQPNLFLGSGGILPQKVNLRDVLPIWKFAQPDRFDELEVEELHKNLLLGLEALNAHI